MRWLGQGGQKGLVCSQGRVRKVWCVVKVELIISSYKFQKSMCCQRMSQQNTTYESTKEVNNQNSVYVNSTVLVEDIGDTDGYVNSPPETKCRLLRLAHRFNCITLIIGNRRRLSKRYGDRCQPSKVCVLFIKYFSEPNI